MHLGRLEDSELITKFNYLPQSVSTYYVSCHLALLSVLVISVDYRFNLLLAVDILRFASFSLPVVCY
jgi:hypothetical protein